VDDAAGEAFDKTAHLLGLGYPGGPALAHLAEEGRVDRYKLPRPMLEQMHKTGNLDFSFSGLKTAVLLLVRKEAPDAAARDDAAAGTAAEVRADAVVGADRTVRADIAASFQEAIVDVLVAKSLYALEQTGLDQLVVAGGVGANRRLRERLDRAAAEEGYSVFYPEFEFCTDNGAMIALAGALRLGGVVGASLCPGGLDPPRGENPLVGLANGGAACNLVGASLCPGGNPLGGLANVPEAERTYAFTVKPRWDLSSTVL